MIVATGYRVCKLQKTYLNKWHKDVCDSDITWLLCQTNRWTTEPSQNTFNSVHTRHPQLDKVTCGWMKMMRFLVQKVLFKISSFHGTPLGIMFAFLKTHTHTLWNVFSSKNIKTLTAVKYGLLLFYACISSSWIIVRLLGSGQISNIYNESNEIHVALGCFFLISTLTFLNNNQWSATSIANNMCCMFLQEALCEYMLTAWSQTSRIRPSCFPRETLQTLPW